MFGYNEKTQNGVLQGVNCDVKSCSYHDSGNNCHAKTITVGCCSAHSANETNCATYELKPGL